MVQTRHLLSGAILLASGAVASRPWIEEPDTGIDLAIPDLPIGELPELEKMVGLPDFDWAARHYLPIQNYTYYRNGAAGEWSYRNNLEVYARYYFKPRTMVDITNIENTLSTTILGYNFSSPFYISPCANGGRGHPDAELNFVRGAAEGDILYMPALLSTKSIEEIGEATAEGQVTFQQVYLDTNDTLTKEIFDRTKAAGSKAIVLTVDSAADGNRHRAARFGVGSADASYSYLTWDYYHHLQNMTSLPIILKGIGNVEDVKLAVKHGVKAVILSNHGGRQIDTSEPALLTALQIHNENPELFDQIEILADGGVRYGADVLKLLALGVKAVGLGRPFMFANIFGQPGIEKVISLLKHEIAIDAGNLGVPDLQEINADYINWNPVGFGA